MLNRYIFKHGLSEGKILEIALDRVLEKPAAKKKNQHDTDFSAHWKSVKKLLTGFSREPGPNCDIRPAYIHRHGFGNSERWKNREISS
jgi:hypothetical protein